MKDCRTAGNAADAAVLLLENIGLKILHIFVKNRSNSISRSLFYYIYRLRNREKYRRNPCEK